MGGVRFLPRSKVIRGPGNLTTPPTRNQVRASLQGSKKLGVVTPLGRRNVNSTPPGRPATGTNGVEYDSKYPATHRISIENRRTEETELEPENGFNMEEGECSNDFERNNADLGGIQSSSEYMDGNVLLMPAPQEKGKENNCKITSEWESEQKVALEECEQTDLKNGTGIKVLVRVRPLNNREIQEGDTSIVKLASQNSLNLRNQNFVFDSVAGPDASQMDIFELVGRPMVENCLAGFNSSIFAYGQTGSGKTHTMMGVFQEKGNSGIRRGLMPRIFDELFSRISQEEEANIAMELKYSLKCSFLEIYNEQIMDLLDPSQRNIQLQLREDVRTGVYVEGLTEEVISTVDDVYQILAQGMANRKVAATTMNNESSRSHSVFTCTIESSSKNVAEGVSAVRFARLSLVDLAGSERQKLTGAGGERLKEAGSINRSLSQLGNVIKLLADMAHSGKSRHIPYRDSRLTFLLQESLGGNAKTAMICNVSPASSNFPETLSTLNFAQRAKAVQNKAKVNEQRTADVNALQKEIRLLKAEISHLKSVNCHTYESENQSQVNSVFQKVCKCHSENHQTQNDDESAFRYLLEENIEIGDVQEEDRKVRERNGTQNNQKLVRWSTGTVPLFNQKARGVLENGRISEESSHGSSLTERKLTFSKKHGDENNQAGFQEEEEEKMGDNTENQFISDSEKMGAWRRNSMAEMRPSPLDKLAAQLRKDLSSPAPRDRSPFKTLNFKSPGSVTNIGGSDRKKRIGTGFWNDKENSPSPLGPHGRRVYEERSDFQTEYENENEENYSSDEEGRNSPLEDRNLRSGQLEKKGRLFRKAVINQGLQVAGISGLTNREDRLGDDQEGSPDGLSSSPKEGGNSNAMEALLAGALRREEAAIEANKKLLLEVDQLNSVVKQYKQERVCHQILQQTRDERMTRLQELSDKLIPPETFLDDEWSSMLSQQKMLQEQLLEHPEVSSEKIERRRLEDELEQMRQFYEEREKEVLLSEIHQLRGHLLTLVDKKTGTFSPMTSPGGGRRQSFSTPEQLLVKRSMNNLRGKSFEAFKGSQKEERDLKDDSPLGGSENSEDEEEENGLKAVEEDEKYEESKREWEEEKDEWIAKEVEWGVREDEWAQLVEQQQIKVQDLEKEVEELIQEVETQRRCTEEAQEAIGRAFEGHARILDQYDDLQERHIALLAKHQKISEGVEDMKQIAGKAGVHPTAVRWFTTYAGKVAKKQVESERERQDAQEQVEGLRAQLKTTAETASELLGRLKRAEDVVSLSHGAAAIAEQRGDDLKREIERMKRRHVAERTKLDEMLRETQRKCVNCTTCSTTSTTKNKTSNHSNDSRVKKPTPRRSRRASATGSEGKEYKNHGISRKKKTPLPATDFLEVTESFEFREETGDAFLNHVKETTNQSGRRESNWDNIDMGDIDGPREGREEREEHNVYVYSLQDSCDFPKSKEYSWGGVGGTLKESPPPSHGGSGSWVDEAPIGNGTETPLRKEHFSKPLQLPMRLSVAFSGGWEERNNNGDVDVLGEDDNPLEDEEVRERDSLREVWRRSRDKGVSLEELSNMDNVPL